MPKYLSYSFPLPSGQWLLKNKWRLRQKNGVKKFFRTLLGPILLSLSVWLPLYLREWLWCKLKKLYPRYSVAGLNHNQSHLERSIIEALFLNRIPVLRNFRLSPLHNLDHPANGDIENFYDLTRSYLRDNTTQTTIPLPYIKEKDFFTLARLKQHNILRIPFDKQVTTAENEKYTLIMKEDSGLPVMSSMKKVSRYTVVLEEAAKIKEYGDAVVEQLGTFYALGYRSYDKHDMKHPSIKKNEKYLALLSVPRLATELLRIFPPGSALYIFANIWNQPDYFKPLTQHYKIYRYYDFPSLSPFIDKQPPNTFMLFAIEKYIAKQAQKIFHVHWNEL